MNPYLKSAVQNLDAYLVQVTNLRNAAAAMLETGVQALEPLRPVSPPAVPIGELVAAGAVPEGYAARRARLAKARLGKGKGETSNNQHSTPNIQGEGAPGRTDNPVLSAMSAEMLAAGRQAAEPLTTAHLTEQTGCSPKQASNAITRWLLNKFIKRVEPGKYRRLAAFPAAKPDDVIVTRKPAAARAATGEQMLAEIHREIDAAKPKED